jgi:SAM-dependent methyltransferase
MSAPEFDSDVVSRMREDWNRRATEDAHYYVAFGRRQQSGDEFFDTAREQVLGFQKEMKRLAPGNYRARRALEIGCGPGRLLKPMSAFFGEIHGIDVSDEMIRRAEENLAGVPHIHVRPAPNSNLAAFADDSFDFVYSYAVFQHIPSREVVFGYLHEAVRVLKPGGILRCQLNGLPQSAKTYDTWAGVRVAPDELYEFAQASRVQLLALEGGGTQYMWITVRLPAPYDDAATPAHVPPAIRRITNAHSSEPVAPVRGRFAALSLWVEGLPSSADLLSLHAGIDGMACRITYLSPPEADGICQLNLLLPGGVSSGLKTVTLSLHQAPFAEGRVRLIPPGPAVPRVVALSDGIDLLSGTRIVSGSVKASLEEVERPDDLTVQLSWLGGSAPGLEPEHFCTNPGVPSHELNFRIPPQIPPGPVEIAISMGRRLLTRTAAVISG